MCWTKRARERIKNNSTLDNARQRSKTGPKFLQVPPNQPQPGSFGGGGRPTNTDATTLEALSLTPPGLVPVSVFPPWAQPRTFPAVAVIFSENPANGATSTTFINKRLSSEMRRRLKRFSRRHYRRKPRVSGIKIWKKFLRDQFNKFRRKTRCAGAKFVARLKFLSSRKRYRKQKNYKDLKECREFREPLFGFRVKVKLVQNQVCTEGLDCTREGFRIHRHRRRFEKWDRQAGESFVSSAPVDCRTSSCDF